MIYKTSLCLPQSPAGKYARRGFHVQMSRDRLTSVSLSITHIGKQINNVEIVLLLSLIDR